MLTESGLKRIIIRVERDLKIIRDHGVNMADEKRRKYSWKKLKRIVSA